MGESDKPIAKLIQNIKIYLHKEEQSWTMYRPEFKTYYKPRSTGRLMKQKDSPEREIHSYIVI